jgi:hypothetical protein
MKRDSNFLKLLLVSLAFATDSVAEDLYVQVRQTVVRASPQYWGAKVAQVAYGDRLAKVSQDEGWLKVKTGGGSLGFVHSSAVTTRRIVFAANAAGQNFSSSDVVLAGKGFNSEVENRYANTKGGVDYRAVDTVESLKVPDSAISEFLTQGKLVR